jgi:RNA polymerase sigma-70 factor (ECF subfamily)
MTPLQRQLIDHIPDLRRLAYALEGARPAADDLMQETLVRAWQRLDTYAPTGAFAAWLATIMRNLFIDRTRRRKTRPEEPIALLPPALEPRGPGDPGARLMLRDLRAAIGTLPRAQRQVLILVAVRGLSYEDVATHLDVPLGTVRSRLFRARETLMRKLDGAASPLPARPSPSRRRAPRRQEARQHAAACRAEPALFLDAVDQTLTQPPLAGE